MNFRKNFPKPKGTFTNIKTIHSIGTEQRISIDQLMFRLDNRAEDWTGSDDKFYGFFPEFQRQQVWSLEQKQNLIYSVLSGVPIGSFFINNTYIGSDTHPNKDLMYKMDNVLFDGMQRFLALFEFLSGDYSITWDGHTGTIEEFDISFRRHILRYPVSLIETNFKDWNQLIDYYILINRGGIAHTEEDFNKAISTKK